MNAARTQERDSVAYRELPGKQIAPDRYLLLHFPRLKTTVRFEYHALPEQRLRFLNWAEPLE